MQLVLTMPHKEFIGKTVLVKGTLFHAFAGHHHTDVVMDVSSIKLDPEVDSARRETQILSAAIVSDEGFEQGGDLLLLAAGKP